MMPARPDTIRIGIIGCGKIAGDWHLPTLRRLPGVGVAAAADTDRDRLDRFAGRFGIDYTTTDYRAVLDRPGVDAVAVLTPTPSHVEICLAALDAGKHVLVEKPLAMSVTDCDRLIARAAASPLKAVVCFNHRWHRAVRRARAFLQAGVLGRITAIHSSYTHNSPAGLDRPWRRMRETGGGVCLNEGVHHFDLWRYLLSRDVEAVSAFSLPSESYDDETSTVSARLSGGVLATGVFKFETAPEDEIEIYGSEGRVAISMYRFDGFEFTPSAVLRGSPADRLRRAAATLRELPAAIRALRKGGEFGSTFDGLWRHFLACVREDRESESTLEDGRRALRTALAAMESAATGKPVALAGG